MFLRDDNAISIFENFHAKNQHTTNGLYLNDIQIIFHQANNQYYLFERTVHDFSTLIVE